MKSTVKSTLVFAAIIFFLVSCATAELSKGKSVSLNAAEITKECQELDIVYGKGGGAFGGAISDENLMKYAMNDMRNRAADLGATHLVPHGTSVGGGLTHSTSANVSGTAYKCPLKK